MFTSNIIGRTVFFTVNDDSVHNGYMKIVDWGYILKILKSFFNKKRTTKYLKKEWGNKYLPWCGTTIIIPIGSFKILSTHMVSIIWTSSVQPTPFRSGIRC